MPVLLLAAACGLAYAPVSSPPLRLLQQQQPRTDAQSNRFLRTSTIALNARPSLYEQYEASRNDADGREFEDTETGSPSLARGEETRDSEREVWYPGAYEGEAAPAWALAATPAPEPSPASESSSRFSGATAAEEVELLDFWRSQQAQAQGSGAITTRARTEVAPAPGSPSWPLFSDTEDDHLEERVPWWRQDTGYSERGRKNRRTVFMHDDWVKHRSSNRFVRNIVSIGSPAASYWPRLAASQQPLLAATCRFRRPAILCRAALSGPERGEPVAARVPTRGLCWAIFWVVSAVLRACQEPPP